MLHFRSTSRENNPRGESRWVARVEGKESTIWRYQSELTIVDNRCSVCEYSVRSKWTVSSWSWSFEMTKRESHCRVSPWSDKKSSDVSINPSKRVYYPGWTMCFDNEHSPDSPARTYPVLRMYVQPGRDIHNPSQHTHQHPRMHTPYIHNKKIQTPGQKGKCISFKQEGGKSLSGGCITSPFVINTCLLVCLFDFSSRSGMYVRSICSMGWVGWLVGNRAVCCWWGGLHWALNYLSRLIPSKPSYPYSSKNHFQKQWLVTNESMQ